MIKSLLQSGGKYLTLIAGVVILFFIMGYKFPFLLYLLEKDGPKIEILSEPQGLGTTPQEFKFKVSDYKSGLELIRVKLDQSRLSNEIYKLDVPLGTKEQEITIKLDSKALKLRQGNVRITIEAFDRSLESNGNKFGFDLPVKFDAPSIELLTSQSNAIQGGMELVIYRVTGDKVKQSGVRIKDKEFVGFPAHLLDPDFINVQGVYFSFYAMPFDYSDNDAPPEIYAKNFVGNETTQGFYFRSKKTKKRTWRYEVNNLEETRFLEPRINQILINLPFSEQRTWTNRIERPRGNILSASIADVLEVRDNSGRESKIFNELLTFRYPNEKMITATTGGKVLAAMTGRGYGKILVIDHGFGLVSVYTNLEDIMVQKGQDVGVNQSLGKSNDLSHTPDSGYEYGLFFQGESVNPAEWWDSYWVEDHVINKFNDVKKRLSINIPLPIPADEPKEEPTRQIIKSLDDLKPEDKRSDDQRVRDF